MAGSNATVNDMWCSLVPLAKYAWMSPCVRGSFGRREIWLYLRVHCCMRVAKSAEVKLSVRLIAQSTLTAMLEPLGLNVDELNVGGMGKVVLLESAAS